MQATNFRVRPWLCSACARTTALLPQSPAAPAATWQWRGQPDALPRRSTAALLCHAWLWRWRPRIRRCEPPQRLQRPRAGGHSQRLWRLRCGGSACVACRAEPNPPVQLLRGGDRRHHVWRSPGCRQKLGRRNGGGRLLARPRSPCPACVERSAAALCKPAREKGRAMRHGTQTNGGPGQPLPALTRLAPPRTSSRSCERARAESESRATVPPANR